MKNIAQYFAPFMAASHLYTYEYLISMGSALLPADRIQHAHGEIVKHAGLTLALRPANERRRYFVTPSLIGWAQT